MYLHLKYTGHGECENFNNCTCENGWLGMDCSKADCSSLNDCSSQGICIAPNTCDCYDGYEGDTCAETAAENIFRPVFWQKRYEITIKEDERVPKLLLTVNATDDDTGKNGQIRYSFDPSGFPFDIEKYIEMDTTGTLILKSPIARATVPSGMIIVTIIAEDRGIPSKSDTAEVIINIIDINTCPVILSPLQGQIYYLNESISEGTHIFTTMAEDLDFGLNKEIIFSIKDPGFIQIDQQNGMLTVYSQPEETGDFVVTIQVKDKSSNPCTVEVSVLLKVFPKDTPMTSASTLTTMVFETSTTFIGTNNIISKTLDLTTSKLETTSEDFKSSSSGSINIVTTISGTATDGTTSLSNVSYSQTDMDEELSTQDATQEKTVAVTPYPEETTTTGTTESDETTEDLTKLNVDEVTIILTDTSGQTSLIVMGVFLGLFFILFIAAVSALVYVKYGAMDKNSESERLSSPPELSQTALHGLPNIGPTNAMAFDQHWLSSSSVVDPTLASHQGEE